MTPPIIDPIDRVVLMGFMGSGKTTVGKLLAGRLGWEFLDLDSVVEDRCGHTVPEIFAEFGEHYFRNEESAAFHTIVSQSRLVIALGGGALERSANQSLLRRLQHTSVVYLEAPFSELQARCSIQAAKIEVNMRPLLADSAAALSRFESRLPIYQGLATFRIDTTHHSPDEVVEAILHHLG